MKREALNTFLSLDNIDLHCNHLKTLRLKLSIIRKSYPDLINGYIICKNRRLLKSVPEEVLFDAEKLLNDIKIHEVYFDSFTTKREKYPKLKQRFSSEDAFLYEIYSSIKNRDYGYVCVYISERGKIDIALTDDAQIYNKYIPLLAVDLYEHSYFYDYLYDKDSYYRRALEKLDLRKIEEALSFS